MDERVKRLKTPEACKIFAKNAIRLKENELAVQALEHAIKLRAQSHGADTQAEKEYLEAVRLFRVFLNV